MVNIWDDRTLSEKTSHDVNRLLAVVLLILARAGTMWASTAVYARLQEPLVVVSQEIASFRFAHDLSVETEAREGDEFEEGVLSSDVSLTVTGRY
jgi:hypothetical protein